MSRPHVHPEDRYATEIKGTWYTGAGDEFAPDTTISLKPGVERGGCPLPRSGIPIRRMNPVSRGEATAFPVCLCVFVVPQRTRATVVEAVVEPCEASVNAMVAQLVPAAEIH